MPRTAYDDSETLAQDDRITVHRFGVPLTGGGEKPRLFVKHPGAVTILPLLADDRVVLIRNDRPAVGATLWELPAGTLEPGEDIAAAAARELQEETGYRADHVQPLCRFFTAPGFCDERMHAFVARGLAHVGQHLNDTENITVHATPWADVRRMMQTGEIADAKTMTTLLFYLQCEDVR